VGQNPSPADDVHVGLFVRVRGGRVDAGRPGRPPQAEGLPHGKSARAATILRWC